MHAHVPAWGQSHGAPGLGLPLTIEADLRGGISGWGVGKGLGINVPLARLAHCPISPPSLGSHSFVWVMASVGRSPLPLDLNAAVERGKGREMGTISNSVSNFF